MKKLNARGFTLIELVLVITVLGILAVAAVPQFINVTQQAAIASRDGVVGAVRSAIALQRANAVVQTGVDTPPASLDGGAAGSTAGPTNLFFGTVMMEGIADGRWSKNATDANIYIYNDGTATSNFTYTPGTGAFAGPT